MDFDWVFAATIVAGNLACYFIGRHTRIKDMENFGIVRREDTGEIVAITMCDDEGHIKRVVWEKKDG